MEAGFLSHLSWQFSDWWHLGEVERGLKPHDAGLFQEHDMFDMIIKREFFFCGFYGLGVVWDEITDKAMAEVNCTCFWGGRTQGDRSHYKTLDSFLLQRTWQQSQKETNAVMIHFMWEAKTFDSVRRHFALTCFNFIVVLTLCIEDYYQKKALETVVWDYRYLEGWWSANYSYSPLWTCNEWEERKCFPVSCVSTE